MKIKASLAFLVLAAATLSAHDHIEVGIDPITPTRLGLHGPVYQLALLVPVGEPFSNYAPNFPGGYYANELTFSAESNVLDPADGANPVIEIISITGPAGGVFSFWETDQTSPTWSRPTGWTSASPAVPAMIPTTIGGNNHIHGRVLTTNIAGTFSITYRALDANNQYQPSMPSTLTFQSLPPPQLQITAQAGNVALSFKSRLNLNYDLQSSTTLAPGSWATVEGLFPIEGDGNDVEVQDPIAGRPRVFYRLIEYR